MKTKWFSGVALLGSIGSLAIGGTGLQGVLPAAQVAVSWHIPESASLTLVGLGMLVVAHHLRRLHSSPRPVNS